MYFINFFTENTNRKRKLDDMMATERMYRKRDLNEMMMNEETATRRQTVRYALRRTESNSPTPTAAPTASTEHEQDNAYIANMLADIDYGSADF